MGHSKASKPEILMLNVHFFKEPSLSLKIFNEIKDIYLNSNETHSKLAAAAAIAAAFAASTMNNVISPTGSASSSQSSFFPNNKLNKLMLISNDIKKDDLK